MKKLFITAGMFTALVFASCRKDRSEPNPGPGNGDATQLLKKVTETKNGVTTVYTFLYDANKRLISFESTDGDQKTIFTYDAAGHVTRVEETETGFKNIYTYTYNNGIPASGTLKSWERENGVTGDLIEDDILTYTVTNDQVTKLHLNMTMVDEEMDFNFTYSNGNLTKVQTVDAGVYTATFTYGTKKPAFPTISKYVLDQAGFSLLFAAKHELLSMAYDFPGTQLDKTVTNQYTYDAKGYPITSNDGETLLKFEYQ